ncbi:MAG: aminotransferase class I/II-fold pyridoxal phosphate-dependent enzyme [Acidobacteriota bacterium]
MPVPAPVLPPGTAYSRRVVLGDDVLRLDGNEGTRPDPGLLVRALDDLTTEELRRYPNQDPLTTDIAARWELSTDRVLLTAGGDDLIDRCCRAQLGPGRRLLLPSPTFEMFERYASLTGCRIERVPWGREGYPVDRLLAAAAEGEPVGLLPVVSPNNPTGAVVSADELERVIVGLPDTLMLLDHAYVEHADEDLTRLALQWPNVVVLRTFSKAWGLAGCRVGYGLGDPEVLAVLKRAGAPHPLAAPSLAIARRRFAEGDESLEPHVRRVRRERASFTTRAERLGLSPRPSQANFVFLDEATKADDDTSPPFLVDALESLGVIVRWLPQAEGVRVTMPGDEAESARLSEALSIVREPEALLLDLDGVLADVTCSQLACILATAADWNVTLTESDVRAAQLAGDANDDWRLTQRLLARAGVEVALEAVTERYQQRYLGTDERPGLQAREGLIPPRELLARLAAERPLAVVTGRPRAEAELFLDRTELTSLFSIVITRDDAALKPDPEPVRLALDRLGFGRAWMVGDTSDDTRAARSAGVLPLAVLPPGLSTSDAETARRSLRSAGAARVLTGLNELVELLP